ncbi:acylphosphatase [Lactobacillus gasseri]|uniref:acylphosphatase n=1 Tax=Lactobacillus gasseri TaxID=1596 RepID=UPI00254C625D|nr:acylphosphatase [Lactobacillus gasseri]MDK6500467.1 acylphosphatase [Lactobacillus gasseri]
MKTVTMKVTGLVQGVGFRWTTQMIAQDLGITGTVKNNPDGSVSIVAQGEELPLEHFIKKIKASPSVAGHVDHVDLNTVSDAEKFTRFSVFY